MTRPVTEPVPERLVPCPTCRGPSVYGPRNAFRPFCSERCRNVDLGAWATEKFRVADAQPPQDAAGDDTATGLH